MGLIGTILGAILDANKMAKQSNAQKDDTMQHVVVGNKYEIDIPSFLSPKKNLFEDASLQYGNSTLGVSFIVIDKPKEKLINAIEELEKESPDFFGKDTSFLDKVATLTINEVFDEEIKINNYTKTIINGLNAVTMNIFQERTFLKDAAYGSYAYIEGNNNIYQILILTRGTSISKLADKLEKSIYSFVSSEQ